MANPNDLDIWKQLLREKYLTKARDYSRNPKCPSCESPKPCYNYYCLLCKVGGLCPTTFRQNGPHSHHPYLQVRRQTGHDAVGADDLEHFIGPNVNHIHKSWLNGSYLCYLECRAPAGDKVEKRLPWSLKGLRRCEVCNYAIPNSKSSKEEFLVCSMRCKKRMAKLRPNLNLLRIRDGAMIGMRPPQTAQEKLSRNPSGSEPARTKSKPQRSAKVRGAVQFQTGTAGHSVESAVESSISRSASEEEEEEDDEDMEDEEYSPRNREDTMVESNEDEDEVYIRGRQGADTMEITGDPVSGGMLEKSRDVEASASAKQRGKASRAIASARQRGKASGASTSASQTDRSSDPEYTCLGLDILCEIFSDGDEEEMSADENDG